MYGLNVRIYWVSFCQRLESYNNLSAIYRYFKMSACFGTPCMIRIKCQNIFQKHRKLKSNFDDDAKNLTNLNDILTLFDRESEINVCLKFNIHVKKMLIKNVLFYLMLLLHYQCSVSLVFCIWCLNVIFKTTNLNKNKRWLKTSSYTKLSMLRQKKNSLDIRYRNMLIFQRVYKCSFLKYLCRYEEYDAGLILM